MLYSIQSDGREPFITDSIGEMVKIFLDLNWNGEVAKVFMKADSNSLAQPMPDKLLATYLLQEQKLHRLIVSRIDNILMELLR